MPQLYTVDDSIAEFFETHTSSKAIRAGCDEFAKRLVGDPVIPVAIEGLFSYTVTAGESQTKIVQFRTKASIIEKDILDLARKTHPQYVPGIDHHEIVEQLDSLVVYIFDKVPGIPYVMAKARDTTSVARSNTVRDMARFFAQAWNSPPNLSEDQVNEIQIGIDNQMNGLVRGLPARFTAVATRLQDLIPLLFNTDHRIVLDHGDLCSLNVLVDPESLHITGLVDWAEARMKPFGLALYGVLNILGWMDSKGWHYFEDYQSLISQFWNALEDEIGSLSESNKLAIRVACSLGIFNQYGYRWEWDGGRKARCRPVTDMDDSIRYLDAWYGHESETNPLLFM